VTPQEETLKEIFDIRF